jgi:hypothetical protein
MKRPWSTGGLSRQKQTNAIYVKMCGRLKILTLVIYKPWDKKLVPKKDRD